jgi:hypothetical protein
MCIPDYKNVDYRGFIFVVHEQHGLLLLHCTRKPKKGPHYQLPGGHVDNVEFEDAGRFMITHNYCHFAIRQISNDFLKFCLTFKFLK